MKVANIKKMVFSALFLAIGLVLPFFTGQIPAVGNMLLPMHIPVLLCGFACGWKYGIAVGAILPLMRSVLFGMPVMFPNAVGMAVELATYGAVTGVFRKRIGRTKWDVYFSLMSAMIIGRVVWGMTSIGLFTLAGSQFTWKIFMVQAFVNAVPGIIIQFLIIPPLVKRLPKEFTMHLKGSCVRRFEPAVTEIEKLVAKKSGKQILIAIDGRCASGKSTLGFYLKDKFNANLIHMDDFFLQKHQRTAERLAEVGGNVDYERFKAEVLEPLCKGQKVEYGIFDCSTLEIRERAVLEDKQITIIEGSYSGHPYFDQPYDLRIFMEIDEESQLDNIRKRNGEQKLKDFIERWIPKEEAYFKQFSVKEKSDVIICWSKNCAKKN